MFSSAVTVEPGTIAKMVIDQGSKRSVWSDGEIKFTDDLSEVVSSGDGRVRIYKPQPEYNDAHCVDRHDNQNVQIVLTGGLYVRGRDGVKGGEERYFGPGTIVDYSDVLCPNDFVEDISGHQRRNDEETTVYLIPKMAAERAS